MKIVILGAGQVGGSVAESLVSENNDITVIDTDAERLEQLQVRLDLRTVVGNAVLPSVLRSAGLDEADLLLALTPSDQINLMVCKMAQAIFTVPTRIARLRSLEFIENPELLSDKVFSVNYAFCPEQAITDYLVKLVDFPEALQVLSFADGCVALVAVRAAAGSPMVGRPISELREHLGANVDARIAALFRRDRPLPPKPDTVIKAGDEVFVLAAEAHIREVLFELHRMQEPVRRVIIAGGGNIGLRVARQLEGRCVVKVIDHNRDRSENIAGRLGPSLILHGEATDEDLLLQESIEETDLFMALTSDDEDNIMAALLAKKLGCKRVLAIVNRRAYADLIQSGRIDIAISPAMVSIGNLLTHVRHGYVAKVHSLRRGAAEAIELKALGDSKSSRVVGRCISELPVIEGATIAAVVRHLEPMEDEAVEHGTSRQGRGEVLIAHRDTRIESGDHVIVFCLNKKVVKKVEKLFEVGFHFF